MLGHASVIGLVPVRDLAGAEKFYGGLLGLRGPGDDRFALVLRAAGGVTIRCALSPDADAQPYTILGWEEPDLPGARYLRARNTGMDAGGR